MRQRHLDRWVGRVTECVYAAELIFRPKRQIFRMGLDSLAVLVLYALGVGGLFAISSTNPS